MKLFPRLYPFGWLRLAFAALLVALLVPVGHAADLATIELNKEIGETVSRNVSTSNSIAMRVKYEGTDDDGNFSIAIAQSTGDITFEADDGTADTTVSTDGTIDTSDSSEDTMGEVADAINASSNWSCILVDVLPSHSANDALNTVSETATGLTDEEGKALTYDTATLDMISASIGPEYQVDEVLTVTNDDLLNRRSDPQGVGTAPHKRNEVWKVVANATYSTGAPDLEVYAVNSDSAGATELLLWSQTGAATGTDSTLDLTDLPPVKGPRGWRLVVVYDDDSTPDITAATIQVHGLSYDE